MVMLKKRLIIIYVYFIIVSFKCKMFGNLKEEVVFVNFLVRRLSRKEVI